MSDILSRMTAKRLARQAAGTPPPFTPKPPPVPPLTPSPPPLPGEMPPVVSKPPPLHGDRGTTVYHGSPHDFQEFSAKHIGSGEGAQAFGHGLYYADDKSIADFYKRNLGRQQLVDDYLKVGDEENLLGRVLADAPMDVVGPRLKDPKQVRLLQALEDEGRLGFDGRTQALKALEQEMRDRATGVGSSFDLSDELVDAYNDLGYGYEVNIDAPARSMLHFNNPLYKQSESVLRGLAETGATDLLRKRDRLTLGPSMFGTNLPDDPIVDEVMTLPGERAYNALAHKYGDIQASKMLQKAGIPGHRYADAHSRVPLGQGKGKAQRTSNTVMYPGSEHLIDITKKYGLLAPLAAEQLMQEE